MLVFVHLNNDIEVLFQGIAVGSEPYYGQDDAGVVVIADAENFGDETRVDVVS